MPSGRCTESRRYVPMMVVAVLVAVAACGGGDSVFDRPAGTTGPSAGTTVDATTTSVAEPEGTDVDVSELEIPEPSMLILDADPGSPVAATFVYEKGPIERMVVFGPKPSTDLPPTAVLVYLEGFEEAFRMDLDAEGRPAVFHLGEIGELRFAFSEESVAVELVAAEGSVDLGSIPLDVGGEQPQAGAGLGSSSGIWAAPASMADAVVDIHRAVFVDVSIESAAGPLPNSFGVPFLLALDCHTWRGTATFACSRVAPQLIDSTASSRLHRLVLTHTVSATAPGVEESIWPSAEACEAALGNDWLKGDIAQAIVTGPYAQSRAMALLTEFAAVPELAAAGPALAQGIAISAAVWFGTWLGNYAGEQLFEGGEGTCEKITQMAVAASMLGGLVTDMAFTIEVCLPPTEGWTLDRECHDVGPFHPFSDDMATTPGDAATLDRNRLPTVTFIATPDPGSIAGRVIDAESGDPIPSATLTLRPSRLEATADGSGNFEIGEVPVGRQRVTASAEGYAEATVRVDVATGETAEVAIELDAVAALALPRTYRGGGSAAWSFSYQSGGCLVEGDTLELTLQADGTLSGFYEWVAPTFHSHGDEPLECADQFFAYGPVEVTGSHTPPETGTSETGTVVVELVGWPEWHIEGEYTPSEMMFEWKIAQVATGYTGDAPNPRIFRAVDYELQYVAES